MIAMLSPGEVVLVPDPCYPIHSFSVLIARGDIRAYDSFEEDDEDYTLLKERQIYKCINEGRNSSHFVSQEVWIAIFGINFLSLTFFFFP